MDSNKIVIAAQEEKEYAHLISLDHVIQTDLTLDEFCSKFIQWIEANGWVTGGYMCEVDEEGNKI